MMQLIPIQWAQGQADKVVEYLINAFNNAVTARSTQIEDKYRKWQQNYDAIPKQAVRSKPFAGASNFMPQLIQMHTDILAARVTGIIAATRPMWRPTTFRTDIPPQAMMALQSWFQFLSLHKLSLFEHTDLLVHSCFKSGTTVLKNWWNEETRFNGAQAITKKDLKLGVMPFEDFFPYPLSSLTLETCEIKFHRIRLTRGEVDYRLNSKIWNEESAKLLITQQTGQGGSNQQIQALLNQGINLTVDTGRPFTAVEAHFLYEVTSGQRSSCVVTFNPFLRGEKSILRSHYALAKNPFSSCFVDFRLFPSDKSFYTKCIPSILEDSQEEQAQIHNSRRDASKIANVPAWKKKRYADTGRPNDEWYPGKVFEVDNMDDLVPLEFTGNYNSMVQEESFLLQLAERYTGVTPAAQGQGSGVNGKGGGYASQGTLAMLAESNRRLDTYVKRVRLPFHRLGENIYTSYRDLGDHDEFTKWGGNAQLLEQLFQADAQLDDGSTFFDLTASDAGANRETDRSGLLLMANTMSAYYHEILQVMQMASSAPPDSPAQKLILQIADGARDLANRLLFAFDIDSREQLLPDLRAVLSGKSGAAAPPELQPTARTSALPESQGPVSPEQLQQLPGQLAQLAGLSSQGRAQ